MEHYFELNLGFLTIASRNDLPSAVDLRIAGKTWTTYLSAEIAAKAVATRTSGNPQLDTLPPESLPADLSVWTQSRPHHFSAEAGPAETDGNLLNKIPSATEIHLETHSVF
jgi:hypothetical protein